MNEIIDKEDIKVEDMIYEIRGKQVMLDFSVSTNKCYGYKYDILVTHYDIDKSITV